MFFWLWACLPSRVLGRLAEPQTSRRLHPTGSIVILIEKAQHFIWAKSFEETYAGTSVALVPSEKTA